ncbi:hypothetical protein PVAP13_4KG396800 [Panicum virgatum]|uniref:Uncharacterized protein n=1 Tax=Panicum virgatum TaxID=38727 RepID=A0A8T0TPT0_PANVG|nr:hypothetical protein PVAP13_4KG396800 [Panicum virgatum]
MAMLHDAKINDICEAHHQGLGGILLLSRRLSLPCFLLCACRPSIWPLLPCQRLMEPTMLWETGKRNALPLQEGKSVHHVQMRDI